MNLQVALNLISFASTYGSGAYDTDVYGGSGVTIGPVTLPVTGALSALVGIILVAVAAGLAVWLYRRHRKTPNN